MSETLIYSGCFASIAFLAAGLVRIADRRIALGAAVIFALYLGIDDLATALGSQTGFALLGGQWNWSGKLYSLLLAALVILALRMHPAAVGFQLPRAQIVPATVLTLCLLVVGIALGLAFEPGVPSLETLAFQATMPSLAEELAYRGIAPALMLGLLHGRKPDTGIPWAVVVATGAMFGIWHGLALDEGSFSFEWIPALYTFIGGIAYGWMRFATGSLLFPLLAHALGNTLFQLAYLFG